MTDRPSSSTSSDGVPPLSASRQGSGCLRRSVAMSTLRSAPSQPLLGRSVTSTRLHETDSPRPSPRLLGSPSLAKLPSSAQSRSKLPPYPHPEPSPLASIRRPLSSSVSKSRLSSMTAASSQLLSTPVHRVVQTNARVSSSRLTAHNSIDTPTTTEERSSGLKKRRSSRHLLEFSDWDDGCKRVKNPRLRRSTSVDCAGWERSTVEGRLTGEGKDGFAEPSSDSQSATAPSTALKSLLKRKIQACDTTLSVNQPLRPRTARRVRFSTIDVLHFARQEGGAAVPARGELVLGMARHPHASYRYSLSDGVTLRCGTSCVPNSPCVRSVLSSTRIPVPMTPEPNLPPLLSADPYAFHADDDDDDDDEVEEGEVILPDEQQQPPQQFLDSQGAPLLVVCDERCANCQPRPLVGPMQRRALLRQSGADLSAAPPAPAASKPSVATDNWTAISCASIREQREQCGCHCENGICLPNICECARDGIKCQMDEPGRPCACRTSADCRNPEGRVVFDMVNVQMHYRSTMTRLRVQEKTGLGSPTIIRFEEEDEHAQRSYCCTPPPSAYQETCTSSDAVPRRAYPVTPTYSRMASQKQAPLPPNANQFLRDDTDKTAQDSTTPTAFTSTPSLLG